LREALVLAAIGVLERSDDPSEITVRTIASEIGISQPSVYLHFQSRDELAYEAAYRLFGNHEAELEERLASVVDPLERVTIRGESYAEFALEHPGTFHLLMMGSGRERNPDRFDGLAEIDDTGTAALVADISAAMDAGQITRRDPELVAMVLWTGVHGVASLLISLPEFPWPPKAKLLRTVLDAQEAALRAPRVPGAAW
jgi:AcrR family transcriptional regulator